MDFSSIESSILRTRDIVVYDVGDGYIPFRVKRQQLATVYYDFIIEKANFLPLGPAGISPPAGTQSYFVDNFQFQLQTIQNEQDMFRLVDTNEILQVFYGASPSYLKTMLKQPVTAYIFTLENNVVPSMNFTEMGIDGYESPLNRPSKRTEFFVFNGLSVYMVLMNTVTVAISPSLNFVINRLMAEPMHDYALIKAILEGRSPAKFVTIGDPTLGKVTFTFSAYGNVKPIPYSSGLTPPELKGLGY